MQPRFNPWYKPMKAKPSVEAINALLPQTQCQLCEYQGCKPYAEAIAAGKTSIDRCLPGGLPTLEALANMTGQSSQPYKKEMQKKSKPESIVTIKEEECIGCTKCINACPVDAIIGSSKQMHSIIEDICTGCDLCIPACPTDCIDITIIPPRDDYEKKTMALQSKARYEKKRARQQEIQKAPILDANAVIAAALAREKNRRSKDL